MTASAVRHAAKRAAVTSLWIAVFVAIALFFASYWAWKSRATWAGCEACSEQLP